jgi:curved DNA-binding protein CbpA
MDPVLPKADPKSRRRSTRVEESVYLTVSGTDAAGEPFVEETGTVNLSFHGCSYFSRHAGAKNSWLSLQIPNQKAGEPPHKLRARVAWNRKSRNLPGLSLVGVEFESPCNVWGLVTPPPDWRKEPDRGQEKDPRQAKAASESDETVFESEMKKLLAVADTGTYYQLLQVTSESPRADVKHNYYEFVRKCHPDRHMDHPEWTQPLEKLMHAVTLAYKTLSDDAARREYDRGLAASGAFSLGRFRTEMQQTTEEYVAAGRKCFRAKDYGGSIHWLRKAVDMEPASSTYHTLLARSLAAVPAYQRQALDHLLKALELDSLNLAAHSQIAGVYEEIKLPWRARLHYQKILEIDAANSDARERLRLLDDAESKSSSRKRSFTDQIFRRS